MLVQQLPRDSTLARELHGEAAEWSVTDYLLANAVDHLAQANWMFATVNRDEDSEPLEYPEALARPGTESATESADPVAGPSDMAPDFLAGFFQ